MVATDPTRPPLPRLLQLEVTGSCNLRCRMCLVRYRPTLGRSASMSLAEFRRLLDDVPGVEDLTLQGLGEPLLAPDIFDMIAHASERGIKVGFNTNATLLNARNGERLLEAGLDWLHLSLDGATRETYSFVRDGARWETVTRNIARFAGLVRERGLERPALTLVMVLMRRNLPELPALIERAAGWGIPRVFTQNLSHDFSDAPPAAYASIAEYVADQSLFALPREEVEGVFEEARATAERLGVDLRLPKLRERLPRDVVEGVHVGCSWPWLGAYVTYDGTVLPCCMVMGSDRAAMGSLRGATFAQIWEGEPYRRFRAGLIEDAPHPVCYGCSLYRGTF